MGEHENTGNGSPTDGEGASGGQLGPLTRQALKEESVPEEFIDGIDEGTLEWDIRRAPQVGVSGDEEVARAISREAALRKDFAITIRRTKAAQAEINPYASRGVYSCLLENSSGERIARTRRYEEALAERGGADSQLFPEGNPTDWTDTSSSESWGSFAFEYRRAAETIAATCTPGDPGPTLVLLMLCRHHLELALKTIIMSGDRLFGNTEDVPSTHSLSHLWNRAEPLIRRAWKEEWEEDVATRAADLLAEFEKADATSMSTRYPVDKGNSPFPKHAPLRNFSVSKFVDAFAEVADFLGLAQLWIEIGLRVAPDDGDDDW